jgi:transposase InsO family protein
MKIPAAARVAGRLLGSWRWGFLVDGLGGRAITILRTDSTFGALEQPLYNRELDGPLVHYSDRGVQYWRSATLRDRWTPGLIPVGRRDDGYDNELAETINGLYKAEVINHLWP